MHRRTLLIVVLLFVAVGMFTVNSVETLKVSSETTQRIVVIMKTGDIRSEYWQTFGEGVKAAAKRYDVIAEITGPLSETDTEGQIKEVEAAIAKKPDAIVLAATDEASLKPAADKIRRAGIKLVAVDAAMNAGPAGSVIATDQNEAGRKAGRYLAGQLPEQGSLKVVILKSGDLSSESQEREEGVKEAMKTSSQIVYSGTMISEATEDRAYEAVKAALSASPDVKGIVSLNEKLTLGAARAIKERSLSGQIKLVGFDSSIYVVKLLEEGVVQATIVQKPFNMGFLSIQSAKRQLDGVNAAPRQYVESLVITKNNMYSQENQQLLFPIVDR